MAQSPEYRRLIAAFEHDRADMDASLAEGAAGEVTP
jgi:hypothetical protein